MAQYSHIHSLGSTWTTVTGKGKLTGSELKLRGRADPGRYKVTLQSKMES